MKTIILFFFIIFACSVAWTQQGRYISGRITDAGDGEPVPSVTVFFTNTTVGTTTDMDGRYRLIIPGEGSYGLTVLHVGYQTVVKDIEPSLTSIVYDVALQIQELEDVVVSAGVQFRRSDINLFWRTLLGKNPSRRTIQATNPESVYYYYNPETKILKITCREPLQIDNYETGYHIQCIVDNFTHDYNTGITDWNVQTVFTDLLSANARQNINWVKKREEVYNVSIVKFIKSLYNNSLDESGFVLADFQLSSDPSRPFRLSILTQDSVLSNISSDNSKTLNLSNHQVLLICYGRPVVENDFAKLDRSQYSGGVDITITGSICQQDEQLDKNGLYRGLLQGRSMRIFSDGTFQPVFTIASINDKNSSPLMGISMRLPLDYNPETSAPLAMLENIADNSYMYDSIFQYFEQQLSMFPQEKIHLHTDRDLYVPGEKIWFKAYIADAASHLNTTNSHYVYVELISPADTLVNRVMILQEEGMFHGYMPIAETVPEGDYTLRAYTRYMENLGDDYFFKKNIRIAGNDVAGSYAERGNSKGIYPLVNDFDVTFYPEGGNLPEGVVHKVAFKALNRTGYPAQVTGYLIDESGIESTPIRTSHAGMGVFSFRPEAGKTYRLKCTNENGVEKVFELPQSNSRARSLAISILSEGINVGIQKSTDAPDIPCYLLVHCRGNVLFLSEMDDQKTVSFDKEELPAGVIQIVLFDEQMNPLSERLVFSKNEATVPIEFHTDKNEYQIRDRIVATLSFPDSLTPSLLVRAGEGLSAHFSIAVTDDKDVAVDESTTILSSLLLSSELKGYIENPAYYLHDPVAMDFLMMTHGWRRYNIPEVVQGRPETPKIPFQQYQTISGRVNTTTIFNRPVPDSEIIIAMEGGGYGVMSTDENGLFIVQELAFPDSTNFFLQALNKKGNDNVKLTVNQDAFPGLVYVLKSVETKIQEPTFMIKEESGLNTFIEKASQRTKYEEDLWTIQLHEVEVSAPIIKKREPRDDFYLNTAASNTITRETIDDYKYSTIQNYLSMIPGLLVSTSYDAGGRIIFSYSIPGNNGPMKFFIDGVEVIDLDDFNYLLPTTIESIDVIKTATLLGVRGAGGAISVTTRRRGDPAPEKQNNFVYTPLGYQQPVEFYAPIYETLEARQSTIPDYRTTIFWKPDVVLSDDGKAIFEFYTSDFPTNYSVVIEGLTADGKIVRQMGKITVGY